MWHFVAQPGLATASVDFTSSFSLLGVGLVGLMWLSTGLIAFMAESSRRLACPGNGPGSRLLWLINSNQKEEEPWQLSAKPSEQAWLRP
jgi:hypothetical protein